VDDGRGYVINESEKRGILKRPKKRQTNKIKEGEKTGIEWIKERRIVLNCIEALAFAVPARQYGKTCDK
jgi:hypothetical protein